MRKSLLCILLLATSAMTVAAQPLIVTPSQTNLLCNGMCTGSAAVSVSGGVPPYTYLWSPGGDTTSAISLLCAGSYTCVVTDNIGTQTGVGFTLTQPPAINMSGSYTNATCYGMCNGTASITVTGGTGSFNYDWAPSAGGNSPYAAGMCAGTYTCIVQDNNGCYDQFTLTITQPPAWNATTTPTHVSCFNGNDGAASVSVNGNSPPYSYSWNPNVGNSDTVTGLSAGSYSCTITDSAGCSIYTSVTITEPPQLVVYHTVIPPPCYGGSATVTITLSGGVPPYVGDSTYTLVAGTYAIPVGDATGCFFPWWVTVTQPSPLTVYSPQVINPTTCGGTDGSIDISVAGGASPYSYQWNTSVSTQDISGLSAGSYYCIITDANGCSNTFNANISDPGAPNVNFNHPVNVVCQNSTPPFALSGNTPSGGTFTGPGVTGNTFDPSQAALGTNFITYSYTDVNGCTASDGDTIRVELCTNITLSAETTHPTAYPNPTTGIFTVTTETGAAIIVYNAFGEIVTSIVASSTNSQLDLTGLAEGIYFVVVLHNDMRSAEKSVLSK